jgi:hypothetical protein
MALAIYWWNLRHPVPPTEVCERITYGYERLEINEQGAA